MRSEFPNLLSLDEWALLMGIGSWRMAGFGVNVPSTRVIRDNTMAADCCDLTCWFEYLYQKGQLSRQDVSIAIMEAESAFFQEIGYHPAPRYTANEKVNYPRAKDGMLGYDSIFQPGGRLKSVQLRGGYLIGLGVQACTLVGEPSIVLTSPLNMKVDVNGTPTDVPDSFELTFTVPEGTTPAELQLFFTAADRFNEPRDQWEIRPINVSIDPDTLLATITGSSYLLVPPALRLAPDTECLDTLDTANYVESVELWRCTLDATDQGRFAWDVRNCVTVPCDPVYQPFCALERGEPGCTYIAPSPASYDTDAGAFKHERLTICQVPDYVYANYVSGIPRVNGRMERLHALIIAQLAASYLECSLCACNCTRAKLEIYRDYAKVKTSEGESGIRGDGYRPMELTDPDKNNPFGQRFGQISAWRMARTRQICNGSSF